MAISYLIFLYLIVLLNIFIFNIFLYFLLTTTNDIIKMIIKKFKFLKKYIN